MIDRDNDNYLYGVLRDCEWMIKYSYLYPNPRLDEVDYPSEILNSKGFIKFHKRNMSRIKNVDRNLISKYYRDNGDSRNCL